MRYLLLSIMLFLSACQAAPQKTDLSGNGLVEKEKKVLQQMQWLKTANAEKFANNAIRHKNFKLYAISGRNIRIPGISTQQKNKLKSQCTIVTIKGTGDTFYSQKHLKLRKLAAKFALQHNKLILPHCL